MQRPNMLAAFKGSRPMPSRYVGRLRVLVGLDEKYRFIAEKVHCLTVTDGMAQAKALADILLRYMPGAVCQLWRIESIGETGSLGNAMAFEDSEGRLYSIRNDDLLLFQESTWEQLDAQGQRLFASIFKLSGCPERELPENIFERTFDPRLPVVSPDELRRLLSRQGKVWTWARIKEEAIASGLSTDNVALKLGLEVDGKAE